MDGYCIPPNYFHIFLFMKVSRKYCVNFYKVYVAANSIADGKAGYSMFPGISGTLHLTKNYIRLQILLKLAVITIDLTEKGSFWKKAFIVYDKEIKIFENWSIVSVCYKIDLRKFLGYAGREAY